MLLQSDKLGYLLAGILPLKKTQAARGAEEGKLARLLFQADGVPLQKFAGTDIEFTGGFQ